MNRLATLYGCQILLVWLVTVSAGIVTAAESDDAKTLRTRVETYWQAQERDDWRTLFGLMSPLYMQGVSEQSFTEAKQRMEKLRFSSADVGRIELEGDYGWAELVYFYQPRGFDGFPPKRAELWDVWKKEAGVYYPVPPELRRDSPGLPPRLRAKSEEKALAERFQQFWQARENQDAAALYELLDPAYRKQVSLQAFMKKRPFYQYLSHKLDWVEVPADSQQGHGKVSFSYKINDPHVSKMPPKQEASVQDWIKVEGHWYRSVPPEPGSRVANPEQKGDKGA